jgi:hypothetical protein
MLNENDLDDDTTHCAESYSLEEIQNYKDWLITELSTLANGGTLPPYLNKIDHIIYLQSELEWATGWINAQKEIS